VVSGIRPTGPLGTITRDLREAQPVRRGPSADGHNHRGHRARGYCWPRLRCQRAQ